MASSRFGRRRRPHLRAISHPLQGQPRRVMCWRLLGLNISLECWSESEWSQLCDAERPSNAALLPGIGWLVLGSVGEEEKREIDEQYKELMAGQRS